MSIIRGKREFDRELPQPTPKSAEEYKRDGFIVEPLEEAFITGNEHEGCVTTEFLLKDLLRRTYAERDSLRAKLAIAIEALNWIANESDFEHCVSEAREALAEVGE